MFNCIGKHYIFQEVTDDDYPSATSDSEQCDVWVFSMDLDMPNNPAGYLGVGDTTDLSPAYAPGNLYAGYKKLSVNAGGYIDVLQNSTPVISGTDKEQSWLLRSGSDPSTLTVKGVSPGQVTLVLEYTPDGQVYPGAQYNADSVNVTVVGVYQIEVYASQWWDVTDYTITVLKGTKYTFRAKPLPVGSAWPSQRPVWTLNGNSIGSPGDTSVEVTFDSEGTKTLVASCGLTDQGKTVTINVVEPTVYQFGVDGEHALNRTPAGDSGWADSGDSIGDPIYFPDDPVPVNRNLPFSVTKNSKSLTLKDVKLKVPQAITYPTVVHLDASGTESWFESGDSSFGLGQTISSAANLLIDGNVINTVRRYNSSFQIQWKYKVPSGTNTWCDIATTSHTEHGASLPGIVRDIRSGSRQVSSVVDGTAGALSVPAGPNSVELIGGN